MANVTQLYGVGAVAAEGAPLEGFVPTVFIALGGSGKDVLMRLRKRFRDRYPSEDPAFNRFARFLFIDTDSREFVPRDQPWAVFADVLPAQPELVRCVITGAEFYHVFDNLDANVRSEHLAWLKPQLRVLGATTVEDGAGTHRQFGRLAFFLNYKPIRQAIERQVSEVLAYAQANQREVMNDRIDVVIVTSVAGGTGCGMFIDVAYLAREVLAAPNYERLQRKHVSVIGFLPTLWEKDRPGLFPRLKQNAYAALLEVEYYGTPRTGDELFLGDALHAGPTGGAGFHVTWDRRDEYIRGTGWNSFFLIDNINNLAPTRPLRRDEVFQMTADYLFLDFEQYRFAQEKRSNHSNLVQFKDRWKVTWIGRDERAADVGGRDGVAGARLDHGTENVFATQNGCMYSSFGLAEIFFDVEKLYQAAGYRLAVHLLAQRWLGPPSRFDDQTYRQWIRRDLVEARPKPNQDPPPLSFHKESLIAWALRSGPEDSLRALEGDFQSLDPDDHDGAAAALLERIRKHKERLAPGGATARIIEGNAARGLGTPLLLGPYRERLRDLTTDHLSDHGATAAARMVALYRQALGEVRNDLAAEPSGDASPELLSRLKEAASVPFHARNVALKIEAEKARDIVHGALRADYRRSAATAMGPVVVSSARYLGAPGEDPGAELRTHGTLHAYIVRTAALLGQIMARLAERFTVASRDDARTDNRKHSLTPPWNDGGYDQWINDVLVNHAEIGRGEGKGADGFEFNWGRVERRVLDKLHSRRADGEAGSLAELVRYWFDANLTNQDNVYKTAQRLADACEALLREGSLMLDQSLQGGNAVDLIDNLPPTDRDVKLRDLLTAAAPYFPIPIARAPDDFEPAHINLFGLKVGDHQASAARAQAIANQVKALAQNFEHGQAGAISDPLEAEQSSLLLVREMAGFPLEYYTRLEELYDAYRTTDTPTHSNDECHINFQESWGDLPDIRAVGVKTYAQIREHINLVLLGIMTGVIVWRESAFSVRVPSTVSGVGTQNHRLSKRISRAIKHACEAGNIRRYLDESWKIWQRDATVRHWACLYASAQKTLVQTNPVIEFERNQRMAVPLRNCYEGLLGMIEERLERAEEGPRWLQALSPKVSNRFEDSPATATGLLHLEEALAQVNDALPLYRVVAAKVLAVELPDQAAAAKPESLSPTQGFDRRTREN